MKIYHGDGDTCRVIEMTGREDLAGVMEMLVFLEADGVVMAQQGISREQ